MFKLLTTLLRGKVQEAEASFAERNALPLLSQQIRDAARGVETARRALAAAMAQARMEKESAGRLEARIAELEARTLAALEKGREDLAREAARSIAFLEGELESARRAETEFSTGIDKLTRSVREGEMRLAALQRGERLAVARERVQRLTHSAPADDLATLDDAEATLSRLRNRQQETELTAEALKELDRHDPETIARRLAEAGCGEPVCPTGEDVLKRLRTRLSCTL